MDKDSGRGRICKGPWAWNTKAYVSGAQTHQQLKPLGNNWNWGTINKAMPVSHFHIFRFNCQRTPKWFEYAYNLGTTWHQQLDTLEFGWTPGVGDGQGGLESCDSRGRKDRTRLSNWNELNWTEPSKLIFSKLFCLVECRRNSGRWTRIVMS